ncbi:MAG TPA: hypothetical protein VK325_09530, partial [Pseudoxanthomonas sp.]|nr:hypothetical protein [Pseudoxanthomonas sp.]
MKYGLKLAVVGLCAASSVSFAQTSSQVSRPWEKYGERIKASQAVAPLGEDLFGDRVGLSKGELSFVARDVEIPGNGTLPMALERQYAVHDRRWLQSTGMLADWDLNLPRLSAVFNPDWVVQPTANHPVTSARCSTFARPPIWRPFEHDDFWSGVSLSLLEQDKGTILQATAAVTLQDGLSYPWVTGDGKVRLACLPSIKNGTGEGFLAITPDGTKYWFDWMAQTIEQRSLGERVPPFGRPEIVRGVRLNHDVEYYMHLRKNTLYATRVEDRFGNNIVFTYSNAWNAPGKLTQIQASDGRSIALTYSGNYVSTVSDGARTWTYRYASTPSRRDTLTQVIRPDGSHWSINFNGFTHGGEIVYRDYTPVGEIMRDCVSVSDPPLNSGNTFVGTMTHPSGAVGTFE